MKAYSADAVEAVCDTIKQHASRGGLVNMRTVWQDLLNLPLDPVVVQDIVRGLERTGFLWHWGEQMVVVRAVRCPKCNRWVHQRLSVHMHEEHPRPISAIVRVEWAD